MTRLESAGSGSQAGRQRLAAVLAIGALAFGGLACGEKDEPDLSTIPQTETAPAVTTPTPAAPTTTAPVAPAP